MPTHFPLSKIAFRLALSACIASGLFATHAAHAAVITVDFSGNPFSIIPYNADGVYLNVVTGATGTSSSSTPGWDINPYYDGTGLFRFFSTATTGVVGTVGLATPVSVGTLVSPVLTFYSGVISASSAPSGINYYGFRFLNETTAQTNYGFLVFDMRFPLAAGSARLLSYSYENTGASITISAVPESSTYAMFALGLVGVGAMVRRRTSVVAQV